MMPAFHFQESARRLRATLLLVIVAAGCGRPPQAIVRGSVTVDGRPVATGRIVFEREGRAYMTTISPEGRYELQTGDRPGFVPGTYSVAVLPPEPEFVADPKTTDLRQVNPVDQRRYPERFRAAATSGVAKTIAVGESSVDIELSSK